MSAERRTHRWAFRHASAAFVLAVSAVGNAQLGAQGLPDLSGIAGAISGAVAPKTAGVFTSGLKVPSLAPGAAAKGIGRQLRQGVETKTGGRNAGLQALEDEMPNTLAKIENGLQGLGLSKRDFGVAVGYFFVTSYEAATGKTVPQDASLAAGRTVAKAVGQAWSARFRAIAPAKQESMYETLLVTPTLLGALATQFEKAGKTADAQAMRQAATSTFRSLFGASPAAVSIDARGMISGLPGGGSRSVRATGSTPRTTTARRPNRPEKPLLPAGGLTPSSLNGARVFIRYSMPDGFSSVSNTFHELVMFPDGSAFDGMPDDPLPSFDAATIRRYSRKSDVGTWKQSGNRLSLTFNGKTESYVKHPKGWADPQNASGSYNVYFPVRVATKAQLLGAWKHKSLTTMGMAGGGAPMVAAGSNRDLTFAANGTYSGAGETFASATTANMGDAFKTGGDVTTSHNGKTGGAGGWRLDGPLLTTVQDGRRGVQLVYILPYWNKDGAAPEIMLGGDWWFRPGKGI